MGETKKIFLAFIFLFLYTVDALAARYTISGYVYEDINGDGDLSDKVGIPNVILNLYDENKTCLDQTSTNSDGSFTFTVNQSGTYYIAIDSKSIEPTEGYNSGYDIGDVWAEQTYAPAGGFCDTDADPSTEPVELLTAGVCFGGAYGNRSDGFNDGSGNYNCDEAEHKARVEINNESVSGLEFGFSFNVVTNINDQDDDTNNNRTCQGCLRQFIQNANAIPGANTMRFVPAVPLNAANWWKIVLNLIDDSNNDYSLPAISDDSTTIDGTAYSYKDGVSIRDENAGVAGHSGFKVGVGPDGIENTGDEEVLPDFYKPELEIDVNKLGNGIVIKSNNNSIRKIAINNTDSANAIRSLIKIESGSNNTVEDCFIGSKADGTWDSNIINDTGINSLLNSYVNIKNNYIYYLHNTGIQIEGEGIVEYNDIYQIGEKNSCGDGISVEQTTEGQRSKDNLILRYNRIENIAAYGIESWNIPGAFTAHNNTILNTGKGDENGAYCGSDTTGYERGGIRVYGVGNEIRENLIYNVPGNGIVVVSVGGDTKQNKISKNSIYNTGGISIDLDQTHNSGNPNGDGVTPNNGTLDTNKINDDMDYPVFTLVEVDGDNLHVTGYVGTSTSKISGTHTIEVYKADDDGNNNGEIEEGDGKSTPHGDGRYYIGSCSTNSDGTFDCNIPIPSNVSVDTQTFITGTAIDSSNNTSEFGAIKRVSSKITGHIYEDVDGNGDLTDKQPLENVTVRLYKTDGTFISETKTDSQGVFSFPIDEDNDYYIVVDSKSILPSAGLSPDYDLKDVWAEQTYAPAGGFCDTDADPSTEPVELLTAGVCFGGAYGNRSDGFNDGSGNYNLSRAEHFVKVTVNGSTISDIDFGFSFNVVTNINDQDDDTNNNRTCQGCLRQFIQNANAIPGANTMRFVPAVPQNKTGYWSIQADHTMSDTNPFTTDNTNPIFRIKDIDTTISGIAYSYKDGSTVIDTNSGTVPGKTVGYINTCSISDFNKPELEVFTTLRNPDDDTEENVWDPYNTNNLGAVIFYTEKDNFSVRNISLYGGHYAIFIDKGNNAKIVDNFLGIPASGLVDPGEGNRSNRGVVVAYPLSSHGVISADIQHNLIGFTRLHGVFVYNIDGNNNFLIQNNYIESPSKGWEYENGIGVEKDTENIAVKCNYISNSCGVGIETWNSIGGHIIESNTIENTGLQNCAEVQEPDKHEKVGIRITSSNNRVRYNVVTGAGTSGILVAYSSSEGLLPEKNLISQNSIFKNGSVSIDLLKDGNNINLGDGVTPNDGSSDSNTGNQGIDYPVLISAIIDKSTLSITGYIGTTSNKLKPPSGETWTIEVYKADDDKNNNGEIEEGDGKSVPHGEGKEFIGTISLTDSDFDDNGIFKKTLTVNGISAGDKITTILIDENNNTSEFGANTSVSGKNKIYGYVYHDGFNVEEDTFIKPNGTKDVYEKWKDKDTSAPTVYIKLCDSNGNVLDMKEVIDGSGYYEFSEVADGTYVIVEDTDNETSNCEPSDPQGWLSITPNRNSVTVTNQSVEINFGDYHGSIIRGYVFTDNGGGSTANANNGLKDDGEIGIKDIPVKACLERDCQNIVDETLTNGEGIYELFIPVEYNGRNLYIVETDKTGYTSTGNTRGNMTAYKNYNDPLEDRNVIDYYYNSTGNISENYNFGDIKKVNIQPSQSYSVPAGSSLSINHTITVHTPGKVAVMLASTEGWPYTVFEDTNCDGTPDGNPISPDNGYYVLNNGNVINAEMDICVVIKTVVPTDVQPQTVEELTVFAYEDWINTDSTIYDDSENVTDTITVSQQLESMLILEKFVKNVSQNGEYTKKNEGKPCDILEYKIVFKNIGSQNIKRLSINDNLPAGTEFVEDQYAGKDIEINFMGTIFTGNINDIPDTDGVEFVDNTLKVDINTLTGKTYIEPGEEGYLLYRVRIEGDNCQ